MKGVIANCLKEMMITRFGADKWEAALTAAGLPRDVTFLATQDIDDAKVLKLVAAVCKVLNVTLEQAADAFGEYWVCTFAPKVYTPYYRNVSTARDFLLSMDEIHRLTTASIPNARPPRFTYEWQGDKTLIMKYDSHRGLIDFLAGLARGVGKYYKENLVVSKIDNSKIKIAFPA